MLSREQFNYKKIIKMLSMKPSKIKNAELAAMGRHQIALSRAQMPGLIALKKQFQELKPLKDAKITIELSITSQTAVLIQVLHALGARVQLCSSSVAGSQDTVVAALAESKLVSVFSYKGLTYLDFWIYGVDALSWEDNSGPDIILSDGFDLLLLVTYGMDCSKYYRENGRLLSEDPTHKIQEEEFFQTINSVVQKDSEFFERIFKNLKGITEHTTSGMTDINRMYENRNCGFPCINVNDSVTKTKFDNLYGAKHSVIDGINRAVDVTIAGKRVLIIGFGDVGKGCASAFRGCGARIYISEIDPICALQACMEGYDVVAIEDVVGIIDIFVTATGSKHLIVLEDMKKMKQSAIVCNMGGWEWEFDFDALVSDPTIKRETIKPGDVDRFTFQEGNSILVLSQGGCVNTGCGKGNPSIVMSASFCNEVLAIIELWNNKSTGKYQNKIYKLTRQLDEKVARLHLNHFGAKLSILTQKQAAYMGIKNIYGPFKSEEYRY